MDQKSAAEAALQAQELAPSGTALFFRFGLSPLLFAPYGLALLVVGSQFLNLQYLAIQRLSSVAWAGVALAVVQEIIDFISWVQRGSSSPSASYYLTGIFSTLLMAVLWIIPLLILIKYLESVEFERLKPVFH